MDSSTRPTSAPQPQAGTPYPQESQPLPPPADPSGNDFAGAAAPTQYSAAPPTQQTTQPPEQPPQQQPPPQDQQQSATQNDPQADQLPYNPNQSALVPGMSKPMPEEILFEWEALSRPFKARNRQYFTTIGLIAALVALILLFAGQMFSVAVIAAVIFVIYVLNTTPPGMVNHKLTTYGIRVENNLYYWEEMGSFWFTDKFGQNILNIEISRFPNRLTLLLGDVSKEDMQLVLSEVLLNQQPPPTAYEKAAAWLQEKLPIDIES